MASGARLIRQRRFRAFSRSERLADAISQTAPTLAPKSAPDQNRPAVRFVCNNADE